MRDGEEAADQGYAQAAILTGLVAELDTWQLDALLEEARDMAEGITRRGGLPPNAISPETARSRKTSPNQ